MFSENMARPLAVLVIYYQRNFTLFPSGDSRIFLQWCSQLVNEGLTFYA